MRGIVTALILEALVVWLAYWVARILWGAQGTVPLLAFVGGLLAIAGALALLAKRGERLSEAEARLMRLREEPADPPTEPLELRRNGHSPYSRTWPETARRGR